MTRKHTPSRVEAEVLYESKRRCCWCFHLDGSLTPKKGQVAHLDHNASNVAKDNLAFFCWDHHDEYDSRTSQSKGITINEVKKARTALHVILWPGGVSPSSPPPQSARVFTADARGAGRWKALIALGAVVASVAILTIAMRSMRHNHVLPPRIRVLVADFDDGGSPQLANYRLTDILLSTLRDTAAEYRGLEVAPLGRALTESSGGLSQLNAEEREANVIIWGYFSTTPQRALVTVRFELLKGPAFLPAKTVDERMVFPVARLELYEVQPGVASELRDLTLVALGMLQYEAGDFDAAIAPLTEVIERRAIHAFNLGPLYFYRGMARSFATKKHDLDSAIDDFSRCIEIQPNADVFFNRANAYASEARFEEALADYRTAAVLHPGMQGIRERVGRTRMFQGLLLMDQHDFQDAAQALSEALRLRARFMPRDVLLFECGVAYKFAGDERRADERFRLVQDPGLRHTISQLKTAGVTQIRFDGAEWVQIRRLVERAEALRCPSGA